MSSPTWAHPTDQRLADYRSGRLDPAAAGEVADHLAKCATCRRVVARSATAPGAEAPSAPGSVVGGQSVTAGADSLVAAAKLPNSPPPVDSIPPGLLDHDSYEIRRELGRGGMGVVYLAHNTMMGRDEVLKVIGRHVMERPGVLERFQNEIRAVARLRHPNIVAAYTAFRLDGGLVFAMEYVEGLDLARLVKAKGPVSVAHAAYFAHQAALGLQHAHEKGMVHRDIKPHNLMLTHDGKARVVKVLDFGLAKATREEKADSGLTTEGQALGTPDYIAPEQILDAASADIRADLYSLGATIYYLLTGGPPFRATSLYDMYQSHISRDAEPLNLVRPEIPVELAAVVAKLMAKSPNQRFETPAEVAQALTPFFKPRERRPSTPSPLLQPEATGPGRPGDVERSTEMAPRAAAPSVSWAGIINLDDPARAGLASPVAGPEPRSRWTTRTKRIAAGSVAGFVALGAFLAIRSRPAEVEIPQAGDRLVRAVRRDLPPGGPVEARQEAPIARAPEPQPPGPEASPPALAVVVERSKPPEAGAAASARGRAAAATVPPGGLVVFLGFDDGKLRDLSGRNHDGIPNGIPPSRSGGAEQDVFESHPSRPYAVSIPLDIDPGRMPQITMGGWFLSRLNDRAAPLISHDNGPFDRTLAIDRRGKSGGQFRWSAFTGRGVLSVADVIVGKWTFVAMRHDQETGKLSVDVEDVRSSLDDVKYTRGHPRTWIGRNPSFGGNFDGMADDVFIYDRFLDDREIAAIRVGRRSAILPPESRSGQSEPWAPVAAWKAEEVVKLPPANKPPLNQPDRAVAAPAAGLLTEVARAAVPSYDLAFAPDGEFVALAMPGWKHAVVNLARGDLASIRGSGPAVVGGFGTLSSILVAADGKIITAHQDQMIRVWDKVSPKPLLTLGATPLGSVFNNLRQSREGGWVIAKSRGEVRIWNPETGKELKRYPTSVTIKHFDLHPDGKRMVVLDDAHVVSITNVMTGELLTSYPDPSRKLVSVDFAPDGQRLLCRSDQMPDLFVINPGNGAVIQTLGGPLANVQHAAFVPRSRLIAATYRDNALRLWNTATGRISQEITFRNGVGKLGVAPDGGHVVVQSGPEAVILKVNAPPR